MRLATTRTAKAALSQTTSYSRGNQSENNNIIVGNNMRTNNNATSGDSSVIGASLIPFLPPDPSNFGQERMFGNIGEATTSNNAILDMAPERNSNSMKKTDLCVLRDPHYYKDDSERSKRNDCLSLLLDGKTPTAFTDGSTSDDCGRRQDRNRQQTRKSRKRILVRGPPQSGKSSLSMNLAYAEAAAGSNCCGGLSCGCVAVIVYRPSGRSHNDDKHNHNRKYYHRDNEYDSDDEQFPLFCRALPVQRGQLSREDTNSDETNDRTNAGSEATALGNTEVATSGATKQDEDYSLDPAILNRIRICRVSSVRDLWEDMLVLAGKPLHEQPTHAIVVEDLDQIIGLREKSSNHNHTSGSSFNNKKQSQLLGMALKTVAIAADTALVIEKNQNEYHPLSSRSNCVTLLLTLTTDSRQQQSGASMNTSNHNLRSAAKNSTDMSDILVLASSIDTVVTLHQQERGIDNTTLETNNNDDDNRETMACVREEPIATATWTTVQTTKNSDDIENCNGSTKNNNNKNNLSNETLLVSSVWQAEIEERGGDQYYANISHGVNGEPDGVSLVDYAFVESFLVEDGNSGLGECEGSKEIRWKHH